jgi:DNA-binding LacI/PurR family transcriptional regulator
MEAPKNRQRSLAVITDLANSEFVRQADRGISRKVVAAGWHFRYLETASLSYPGRLALIKQLISGGEFSAALFVHLALNDDQAALFRVAGMPLGYLGGSLRDVDCVASDESEGSYQATRHLIDLGHKSLAILAPPEDMAEAFLRVEGFQRALTERSLSLGSGAEIHLPDFSSEAGAAAVAQVLKLRPRPTAVFVAAGDTAALGFMQALQARSLNVPRDISVIGYDDLPQAESSNPPLSTVRQPLEAMAAKLSEVLIDSVLRPRPRLPLQQNFDPELVLRLSTNIPPRR